MEQRLKGPKCPLLPKTTVLPLHGGIPAPGLLPERSFFTVGHDDSFDWLSLSPSVTAYSVLTICVVPNSGKPPYWLSVSVKRYAPPFASLSSTSAVGGIKHLTTGAQKGAKEKAVGPLLGQTGVV